MKYISTTGVVFEVINTFELTGWYECKTSYNCKSKYNPNGNNIVMVNQKFINTLQQC
jgi:hypothetical protein